MGDRVASFLPFHLPSFQTFKSLLRGYMDKQDKTVALIEYRYLVTMQYS